MVVVVCSVLTATPNTRQPGQSLLAVGPLVWLFHHHSSREGWWSSTPCELSVWGEYAMLCSMRNSVVLKSAKGRAGNW